MGCGNTKSEQAEHSDPLMVQSQGSKTKKIFN